jgi:hypothetical protein
MEKVVCRIIENKKDYVKNDHMISFEFKDHLYIQCISLVLSYEGPGVIVDITYLSKLNQIEIIKEFKYHDIYNMLD